MRHYELTCLGQDDSIQERVSSIIAKEQGILVSSAKKANLTVLNFQMTPEKVADLKQKLSEDSQIERFMLLAKKPSRLVTTSSKRRFEPRKPKEKVEMAEIEKKLEEILKD